MVNGKLSNDDLVLSKSEQTLLNKLCKSLAITPELSATNRPVISSRKPIIKDVSCDNCSNTLEVEDVTDVPSHVMNTNVLLQNNYPNNKEYDNTKIMATTEVVKSVDIPDIVPQQGRVWIIASSSVEHEKIPTISNYIRAHNFVSSFVMHEVEGKPDECIFEWVVCVDIKGNIPRFILNRVNNCATLFCVWKISFYYLLIGFWIQYAEFCSICAEIRHGSA